MTLGLMTPNRFGDRNQLHSSLILSRTSKILFSILYSAGYVLFPWEYLLGSSFPDKLNYIDRFVEIQTLGFDSINPVGGILGAFISESLWGLILYSFGINGFNAEQALIFISFISLFPIVLFVCSKINFALAAIFLLNPLVVDFVMAQQRSALAFAGFLAFVNTKAFPIRMLILFACLFIHVAFVLLLAGFLSAKALARLRVMNLSLFNRAAHWLIAFIAALVLLFSKDLILGALGDRRAGGYEGSHSIMYAFFWFAMTIYIVVFSRSRVDWLLDFLFLFIALFMVAVLLNTYSSRYLVFALPFFIIALASLPFKEAVLGYFLLFCYQFVQWIHWWGWFI